MTSLTSNITEFSICGKFFMIASATDIKQFTIKGIAVGKSLTIPSITCLISVVKVVIKVGNIFVTALINEVITVGKAFVMFSIIGVILFIIAPKDFAKLFVNLAISADGLPNPAIKSCHAAPK